MAYDDTPYFRFEIGDIVKEDELIVFWDKGPLIGLVINVEREVYWFAYSDDSIYQDRLTILWFKEPYVEQLPSDLVLLVSRVDYRSDDEEK